MLRAAAKGLRFGGRDLQGVRVLPHRLPLGGLRLDAGEGDHCDLGWVGPGKLDLNLDPGRLRIRSIDELERLIGDPDASSLLIPGSPAAAFT